MTTTIQPRMMTDAELQSLVPADVPDRKRLVEALRVGPGDLSENQLAGTIRNHVLCCLNHAATEALGGPAVIAAYCGVAAEVLERDLSGFDEYVDALIAVVGTGENAVSHDSASRVVLVKRPDLVSQRFGVK